MGYIWSLPKLHPRLQRHRLCQSRLRLQQPHLLRVLTLQAVYMLKEAMLTASTGTW
jgi:hypothetical protein